MGNVFDFGVFRVKLDSLWKQGLTNSFSDFDIRLTTNQFLGTISRTVILRPFLVIYRQPRRLLEGLIIPRQNAKRNNVAAKY
jgi:hypothetical protein